MVVTIFGNYYAVDRIFYECLIQDIRMVGVVVSFSVQLVGKGHMC